jgi:hypothetical protein
MCRLRSHAMAHHDHDNQQKRADELQRRFEGIERALPPGAESTDNGEKGEDEQN